MWRDYIPINRNFNPRKHLTIKDIRLSKQVLEVVIKHSKTDQTGKGSKVIIGPGNHRLCPLKLLRKFLQYRKQAPRSDALFRFHNTSLLTRAKLQRTLQEALQTLGSQMQIWDTQSPNWICHSCSHGRGSHGHHQNDG